MADSDFEIDPAGLGPVGAALVDASTQFSTGAEALRSLGDYLDPDVRRFAGVGEESLAPTLATASQDWHRTVSRLADSALELSTAVDLTSSLYAEADTVTAAGFGTTGG